MRIKLAIIAVLAVILALLFWPSTQKILFHTESEFGPIWVYEEDNQRRLSFNGVPAHLIQSQIHLDRPEHLVAPYNQMLMSSLFFTSNPKKILMIGLGGATTAKALNLLLPKTPIDIVEINPALPPIAAEYFDFREDARNKIFIEDGVGFMKNAAKNSYDLIILDAFDIDYIPPGFLTLS
ncbi:MAG: hypothetical protein COA94_06470 [Rickettsiales bacterium]|nr:MAG: hypothetical protein COA94_06470 [Rickettsiales bacterium]